MSPKIKIHVLHTGEVCVSPGLPYHDDKVKSPLQLGILSPYGRKNRIWIPVSCYLIEHPKGLILFDTGWSREMSPNGEYDKKAQKKHLGFMHYCLNQGRVPMGETAAEQLAKRGIRPEDIDYVILSHMHSDHASALRSFKNAKRILLSEEEYADITKYAYRYATGQWKGVELKTFHLENTGIGPVGKSLDLFGDGSIELINIPGHTNGLCAMKVSNGERFVLLFADGGYAERSWREMIRPGTALDGDMAMKSLKWVHDTALDPNCMEALANHDPDVKPHTIEV